MIWDILSILPVIIFYLIFPIYCFFAGNIFYALQLILYGILLDLSISSIKWATSKLSSVPSWMKRPPNACDCDMFNRGGKVGGEPGFPSGHSAMVCYSMLSVSQYFQPIYQNSYFIAFLIILGTLTARWMKSCHNLIQIIIGAILGILTYHFFVKNPDTITPQHVSLEPYLSNTPHTNLDVVL